MHFDPSILYEAPSDQPQDPNNPTNTQQPNTTPDSFSSDQGSTDFSGMNSFDSNAQLPTEEEDNQTILIRLITLTKNFDTLFRKFELLFPECKMNDIVENRLIIIKKMLTYIIDHKDDREKILDAYKLIVSFIQITDRHLTGYVKYKIKMDKIIASNKVKSKDEENENE